MSTASTTSGRQDVDLVEECAVQLGEVAVRAAVE
jgi:hypothetical protein